MFAFGGHFDHILEHDANLLVLNYFCYLNKMCKCTSKAGFVGGGGGALMIKCFTPANCDISLHTPGQSCAGQDNSSNQK